MKSILFYWGKGADTRVAIIKAISTCNEKNEPCFLNQIAQTIDLSHVAIMKHLSLLVEEGYVRELNPQGKPIYIELTENGKKILREFTK
jgi:DNA-binding transcriptional ArsR family regulator